MMTDGPARRALPAPSPRPHLAVSGAVPSRRAPAGQRGRRVAERLDAGRSGAPRRSGDDE